MADNDDVCLVVPVFNEGPVLGGVLAQALAVFPRVIAVDDGSSDGSAATARAAGAIVVEHPINLGQGAALQTGFDLALRIPEVEFVVTFDADGQHRVDDAVSMVDVLRAGRADVVFGSRFLDERTRVSGLKRIVLRVAVVYSRFSTGVRLSDTHNGLRAFNRQAVSTLQIRQNRMAHASEIVEQVGRSSLRWVEHPVHIIYTDYSRSKGQSVLNAVNILTELIYK